MKCYVPKKYESKVLNYLKDAIALYDGDTLSGGNFERFNEIVYVLGNLVNLPPLRSNNQVKRRFISSARTELFSEGEETFLSLDSYK